MNAACTHHKNKCAAPDQENSAFESSFENHSAANEERKSFATLRARFAIAGHSLSRTTAPDGSIVYLATRWGLVRQLPTIEAATAFLLRIGGSV
jgi:hypothetical protein